MPLSRVVSDGEAKTEHVEQRGPVPSPMLQISDLKPMRSLCPYCDGPRMVLTHRPPTPGESTAHFYDLVGGYTAYLGHSGRSKPCPSCEVRVAAERSVPRIPGRTVVEPSQTRADETQALRAEIEELKRERAGGKAKAKEPASLPATRQVVTRAALEALAKAFQPGFNPAIAGAFELGRRFVQPLLDRMSAGDFGLIGQLQDGDADRGTTQGPLARDVDRNAATAKAGRGVIRGAYIVNRERTTNTWGETIVEPYREQIIVDAIVGPDPLIFIHLQGEGE